MSDPYIGEIRMFGGNFAPVGWLLCQGQLLPISQYDVLFNLIGTTYGGDGQEHLRAAQPGQPGCRCTRARASCSARWPGWRRSP